jgi:NADH:ubiquinone oxidoreductase subunit K
MWALIERVLWLFVLCIAGVAACVTYSVCLIIFTRRHPATTKPNEVIEIDEIDDDVLVINI